jgi:hypothetical protein
MSLLQHTVLVLVFKQKLCHSLTRFLGSVFFLLYFSSSCLVSSSLSEVWQFKFVCCPLFPRSTLSLTSCPALEMGFCCAGLLGFFSLPCPLSLGQGQWSVSQPPAVSMLWWFADRFSILQCHLTLDVAHWLRRWALWSTTCPTSGSSLSSACCWPFCLSSFCLLEVHVEISFLPLPHLQCTYNTPPPLLCVTFQFLVYCSGVFL